MNSSIWVLRKQMLPLSWEIGRKSMEATADLWMGIRKSSRERPEARRVSWLREDLERVFRKGCI